LPASKTAAKTAATQPEAKDSVDALHEMIMKSLDDDQAVETISIPLAGKSAIADHMIIASGRSTRQVASMAENWPAPSKPNLGAARGSKACLRQIGC
jgi:ribosome-associated protein